MWALVASKTLASPLFEILNTPLNSNQYSITPICRNFSAGSLYNSESNTSLYETGSGPGLYNSESNTSSYETGAVFHRRFSYDFSFQIIHGDVAGRNVLVSDGFILKISDFGLANVVPNQQHSCQHKLSVSCPHMWHNWKFPTSDWLTWYPINNIHVSINYRWVARTCDTIENFRLRIG